MNDPISARVSELSNEALLDLIDRAIDAGWLPDRTCRVLEADGRWARRCLA